MSTAIAVARRLVQLAHLPEEEDPLTGHRLHRLLYFAQGWSLALRNSALFEDPIESGVLGPVVPILAETVKHGKDNRIVRLAPPKRDDLTEEEDRFLLLFWEVFRDFTINKLAQMIYEELPWRRTLPGSQLSLDGIDYSFSQKEVPVPFFAYDQRVRAKEEAAEKQIAILPHFDKRQLAMMAVRPVKNGKG